MIDFLFDLWGWKQSNDAAEKAERIAKENSVTLMETAEANIGLMKEAAAWNAGSVLRIAEANATAVEDVYHNNAELMAFEGKELIRRHFLEEQQHLGTLRAMQGGNSISVNEGNPLRQLVDQAAEAKYSRNYQIERIKKSVLNYMFEQQTRADIIRLEGRERADALIYNADIESMVALNEASAQALAMYRGGSLAGAQLRAQGTSYLMDAAGKAYEWFST